MGAWAGSGSSISIARKTRCERGAQGIAVGVVKAMWRSVDVARLSKRKAHSRFRVLGRSSVEALGLRLEDLHRLTASITLLISVDGPEYW